MKKLKLKLDSNVEVLNEQEMKMVVGGYDHISGLKCGESKRVEFCACEDGVGSWYQCEGANVSSWACESKKFYCD